MGKDISVIELVVSLWPIFLSLLALAVWLVRLEGKLSACEKNDDRHEHWQGVMDEKHNNLDSKIVTELSQINKSLSRLEGRLGIELQNNN